MAHHRGKYGPTYPGTDIPAGQIGQVCKSVDLLKVESDKVLEAYLRVQLDATRLTAGELTYIIERLGEFTEQLKTFEEL